MRKIFSLYVVVFMGFVLYSMTVPIFTGMILTPHQGYISDGSTSNPYLILGILMSLFPLGQFFGSPVLGALSDKIGRKKTLLISLTLSFIFYLFVSIAMHIKSLALLAPMLFCAGLSEGNVAIAQAAIVDSVKKHLHGKYFGYVYLTASLSFVFGPLFASIFANPKINPSFNYATPFWIMTPILALVALLIYLTLKETTQIDKSSHSLRHALFNFAKIFSHPLKRLFFLNFLLYLAIFGFLRVYSIYLVDEFHIGFVELTYFVSYVSLPIIFANLCITPLLTKRFTPAFITKTASFFMGLFIIIILIPDSKYAFLVTVFFATAFLAITMTFAAYNISSKANASEQGSVMGNNQALLMAAEGLSGFFGGLIAMFWTKLPLLAFGLLALFASVFFKKEEVL